VILEDVKTGMLLYVLQWLALSRFAGKSNACCLVSGKKTGSYSLRASDCQGGNGALSILHKALSYLV